MGQSGPSGAMVGLSARGRSDALGCCSQAMRLRNNPNPIWIIAHSNSRPWTIDNHSADGSPESHRLGRTVKQLFGDFKSLCRAADERSCNSIDDQNLQCHTSNMVEQEPSPAREGVHLCDLLFNWKGNNYRWQEPSANSPDQHEIA